MIAKEAREKAINHNSNNEVEEYKLIMGNINKAVAHGKFKTTFDTISESNADRLASNGYKIVTIMCGYNEQEVIVSW